MDAKHNETALLMAGLCLATALQAQPSPPLAAPASIFGNIERVATKREVAPARTTRALVAAEADASLHALATAHLKAPGNVALMLIDGGRIVFEGYSKGADASKRFISMSMAKSLTALAVGEAHCAGLIANLRCRGAPRSHSGELWLPHHPMQARVVAPKGSSRDPGSCIGGDGSTSAEGA